MLGSNFWSYFIVELTLSLCRVRLLCVKLLCPLNTTPFQAFKPILSEPNFQCLSSISKLNAPCLTLLPSTSPISKIVFNRPVFADYQTSSLLCVHGPRSLALHSPRSTFSSCCHTESLLPTINRLYFFAFTVQGPSLPSFLVPIQIQIQIQISTCPQLLSWLFTTLRHVQFR